MSTAHCLRELKESLSMEFYLPLNFGFSLLGLSVFVFNDGLFRG